MWRQAGRGARCRFVSCRGWAGSGRVSGETPSKGFVAAEIALSGFHFDALGEFDFRPGFFGGGG